MGDVTEVVEEAVEEAVDGVVGPVLDGETDADEDTAGGSTTTTKVTRAGKHRQVAAAGDNGATPQHAIHAGALPKTGASGLPLAPLAGGAALAAGGIGLRRLVVRAGR